MNQAFHLYQLQKVDIQINNIQSRINEIDAIISRDKRIADAEENIHIARLAIDKTKKSLRELEETGKAIRLEIETNEAAMYSGKIRNPKELADLQNKVNADKKNRDKNDDAQLEGLMDLEIREEEIKKLCELLQRVQSEVATSHSLLQGEKSQLLKQKATFETERNAKAASLQNESLEIYSRLIKQKNGSAVALVEDRACEACGAPLTPAEWQSVRSSSELFFCSTCGRILYAN